MKRTAPYKYDAATTLNQSTYDLSARISAAIREATEPAPRTGLLVEVYNVYEEGSTWYKPGIYSTYVGRYRFVSLYIYIDIEHLSPLFLAQEPAHKFAYRSNLYNFYFDPLFTSAT